MWAHVIAALVTALAFYTLPIAILYLTSYKKYLPQQRAYLLFAILTVASGTTYALDAWSVWQGNFEWTVLAKIVTAILSVLAAIVLTAELPRLLRMATPSALGELNALLDQRLAEGTDALERSTRSLEEAKISKSPLERRLLDVSRALVSQLRLIETIFETLPLGVAIAEDPECKKVRANRALADLLGLGDNEPGNISVTVPEVPTYKVLLDGRELDTAEFPMHRASAEGEAIKGVVHQIVRADGESYDLLCFASPLLDEQGSVTGSVGVFADITAQKQLETTLAESVRQKEILIREVHHRVKNNLQVISSLLRAQSDSLTDPESIRPFEESQRRLRAIALVHQKLYRGDNVEEVSVYEYLLEMTTELVRANARVPINSFVNVEPRSLTIPIDVMVPVGLVANELICNSLKHAFPNGERGKIEVKATGEESGMLVLAISDSGTGVDDFVKLNEESDSLGWRIVRLLTAQLNGKISLKSGEGFTVVLELPLEAKQFGHVAKSQAASRETH